MGKRKKQTALILRKARLGKGFTQQYVAVNANTNIRAYQRLESGERDIGNASMRFGLSVCLSDPRFESVHAGVGRPERCRRKLNFQNASNWTLLSLNMYAIIICSRSNTAM